MSENGNGKKEWATLSIHFNPQNGEFELHLPKGIAPIVIFGMLGFANAQIIRHIAEAPEEERRIVKPHLVMQ